MAEVSEKPRARRRTKIMAIAAAGAVLAAGVGVTSLAAWTDTEWVNGGFNGIPGLGTSKFEVEQNVTTAVDGTGWTNDLASPGGTVDFTAAAKTLTPGDIVYGFVRLRTQPGSVAGTESLVTDTLTATGLAQYLNYGASVLLPGAGTSCTLANFAAGTVLTPLASPLTANGTATFPVAAAGASTPGVERVICFQIAMASTGVPDTAQGLAFNPIWHFSAQSN